jgi:hypothetical protein
MVIVPPFLQRVLMPVPDQRGNRIMIWKIQSRAAKESKKGRDSIRQDAVAPSA